jgi:DNA ligase 1
MAPALLATVLPDPTGWWISEKLDGVRAIWTGSRLISRNGKVFDAPKWFLAGLPRGIRLDGELFAGRGGFPRVVSAIQTKGGDWEGITYHVFDLAEAGPFEDRLQRLQSLTLPAHVHIVNHRPCVGDADLDATERDIVAAGGEGLVIRRPGSPYRPGRIGDVVKVKRIVADYDHPQRASYE